MIEKEKFIRNLNDKPKFQKKLFHYKSVLNISDSIINYNNEKANVLKKGLLNFYVNLDYDSLDKMESAKKYEKHILPLAHYLIEKEGFRSKGDFWKYIIFGGVIDVILHLSLSKYNYPLAVILFFILGYIRRKERIAKKKFFSINW